MHHTGVDSRRTRKKRRFVRRIIMAARFLRQHRFIPALGFYIALCAVVVSVALYARNGRGGVAEALAEGHSEDAASDRTQTSPSANSQTPVNEPTNGITFDAAEGTITIDGSLLLSADYTYAEDDAAKVYTFTLNLDIPTKRVWAEPIDGVALVSADGGGLTITAQSFAYFDAALRDGGLVIKRTPYIDKYKVVVCVDPGHGGGDTGTLYRQIYEKDINLAVSLKLLALMKPLESSGVKCVMTRYDDTGVTLANRTALGNASSFMVSVHNNAMENNSYVKGTCTLFRTHTDTDKPFTSKELAETLQNNLVTALGSKDRGIEYADVYYILNHTVVPTVITEAGFVTNADERALLTDGDYQDKIAQALFAGIMESAARFGD